MKIIDQHKKIILSLWNLRCRLPFAFRGMRSILFFIVIIKSSSCKKFVEIDPPTDQTVSSIVFSNDQVATSAVIGLYSKMMESNLIITNGGMSVFPGLSSDEIYNTSSATQYDPFFNNSIPSNETITNYVRLWQKGYNFIYQANAVLEGLASSTGVSSAIKQRLTGEAKFARAFCYFYLVNLYGEVPLQTTTDYRINAVSSRISVERVYQQIIEDIQDAKNSLSTNYPGPDRVRPNKWTTAALLARVYLYRKNWLEAETEATAVLSSGSYSLITNLNNVFISSSNETIFQLMPANANTAEGAVFIPPSSIVRPTFALTTHLLNAFEGADKRKISWLSFNTISGQAYYYPYKYKIRSSTTVTEYNVVLRMAELFLIRAEARAQQDNIAGAQADLNSIRTRAGLPNTQAATKPDLLAAIEKERQTEFFAEWGHRWLDLKRNDRADAVLSVVKGANWQSTDVIYPIPLSEIQLNPFLTQNAGY